MMKISKRYSIAEIATELGFTNHAIRVRAEMLEITPVDTVRNKKTNKYDVHLYSLEQFELIRDYKRKDKEFKKPADMQVVKSETDEMVFFAFHDGREIKFEVLSNNFIKNASLFSHPEKLFLKQNGFLF